MRSVRVLAFLLALAGPCAGAAPASAAEVRRLEVLVLVYTRSFAHVMSASELERLQEEIVEFADFYRTHGGDRVDFRFTLLQLDRQLRREEVSEVSPGRYYLSRENVAAELDALGMRGRFDEVVAFYAWHNANPDAAVLAYGGGAVGPDGGFLGDAGFNSIGVFAWDPGRIAQIAVHEVLHNVDDMFSRSGMADAFFNSDEMSRNLPRLLAERPGAFLPYFSDREMLAYALREQAGKEMYPWWMQRIYYAWMLERTPAAAWSGLRYGRMAESAHGRGPRALYDEVYVSRATRRLYLPVLDAAGRVAVNAGGAALAASPRRYALEDFDGTPLVERDYHAAWVVLGGTDSIVPVRFRPGGTTTVHRLRLGDVLAPALAVGAAGAAATLAVRVVEAGWPEPGAPLAAAVTVTVGGDTLYAGAADSAHEVRVARAGSGHIRARARSFHIADVPVRVELRQPWSIHGAGSLEAGMASPAGVRIALRDDRALEAEVRAEVVGRTVPLARLPGGDYHVVLDSLPPGLHPVQLVAERADGTSVRDTVLVYARPTGWIRVPAAIEAAADRPLTLEASVRSRMGAALRGLRLPLVALAGTQLVPLVEADTSGTYTASLALPPGQHRIFVTSLEGDFQRRVVIANVRGTAGTPAPVPAAPGVLPGATGPLPYAAALHAETPPVLDGELGEWRGEPLRIGAASPLLTGADAYRGAADASAELWFAWSDSTLYVAGRVRDDEVTTGEAWDRDRVNLVFDWRENDTPLTYGSDGRAEPADWQADDAWVFFQPFWSATAPGVPRRIDSGGTTALAGARLASRRTADGYAFELALPAAALPEYAPFAGHVAALQVFLTDGDEGEALTELMWSHRWGYSAEGGLAWELPRMGRLVFLEAAR